MGWGLSQLYTPQDKGSRGLACGGDVVSLLLLVFDG